MTLRRLWDWFWRPSLKWGLGPLLIVGGIGGILFWGGFHTAMESTNTLEFCISCHEMESTVYREYKETVHYNNPSGVRAICTDCHVPREWQHMVVAKIIATKDLYYHFTGKVATPELFEEHRAEMAKAVWAKMEASDSRECRNCHAFESMAFHKQSERGAKEMQAAMEKGETCITCHKGVAHKLPDLSSGYKAMFEELQALAEDEGAREDLLYAIDELPFYLEAADVGDGKKAGVVLSATALRVLDRDGNALKVRIEGWRQEGADRVIYELMSHRIFTATLTPAVLDQVNVGEPQVDPDTELTWLPVDIEGWVEAANLIDDREPLWAYGAEMYTASCATCHGKPEPDHYLANQWIGNLKSMQRFISLDKREYRFLQKYLQLHASDTGGKGHAH